MDGIHFILALFFIVIKVSIQCTILQYFINLKEINHPNILLIKNKILLLHSQFGMQLSPVEYASGGIEMSLNKQKCKLLNIKELSYFLTPFLLPANKFRLKFSGNLVQIKVNCGLIAIYKTFCAPLVFITINIVLQTSNLETALNRTVLAHL